MICPATSTLQAFPRRTGSSQAACCQPARCFVATQPTCQQGLLPGQCEQNIHYVPLHLRLALCHHHCHHSHPRCWRRLRQPLKAKNHPPQIKGQGHIESFFPIAQETNLFPQAWEEIAYGALPLNQRELLLWLAAPAPTSTCTQAAFLMGDLDDSS